MTDPHQIIIFDPHGGFATAIKTMYTYRIQRLRHSPHIFLADLHHLGDKFAWLLLINSGTVNGQYLKFESNSFQGFNLSFVRFINILYTGCKQVPLEKHSSIVSKKDYKKD